MKQTNQEQQFSNNLNIGDIKVATGFADKVYEGIPGNRLNWVAEPLDNDIAVVVLGWVHVPYGLVHAGGWTSKYGQYADEYEPAYLQTEGTYKVWRVQPLEKNGRWRKPLTVFENQLEG